MTLHSDFGTKHFETFGFPKDVKCVVATISALLEEEGSTDDGQEDAREQSSECSDSVAVGTVKSLFTVQ